MIASEVKTPAIHTVESSQDPRDRTSVTPHLKTVALVLADISSYTDFIKFNRRSLLHASEIVSELLESVIDKAEFPLVLNKIEGDATLFYSDIGRDPSLGAQDVVRQISGFFDVFDGKTSEIAANRQSCSCDACQNVTKLQLKVVLHAGEIAVRNIRQFEEISGENVILVHRLLKNSIADREYVLMTEVFRQLVDGMSLNDGETREEVYDDLGSVKVRVFLLGQFPGTSAHYHSSESS
ncbi:MAG: DUF2652 domain-containing protein [Ignavibacteriales bacterium]|nr:DUF2652 domain-containing protein [Ignavibacteriales bacterium]